MARRKNDRREKFIQAYLLDPNATKAAELAGYKQPGMAGSRLMKNDKIKSEISVRNQKVAEKVIEKVKIDTEWVVERLIENHNRAMQAEPVLDSTGRETGVYRYEGAVANKALELLGRYTGGFANRLELSGEIGLRALSDGELDKRIEDFEGQLRCLPSGEDPPPQKQLSG